MARKFIPNGDSDFATMASCFARNVGAELGRFEIAQGDWDELSAAVDRFKAALQKCRHGERSESATRLKDDARADAEKIVRRLGNLIRNNERIDAATKIIAGIRPRATKAKQLECPQEPPRLRFVRALHEGNGVTPMHELWFSSLDDKPRAEGAVRLELFVDLVGPDEPIPAHPAANHGSRPWYLRSYTRSPIKLIPPIARLPMRVLYWGRWADSMGGVGPFSATAVGWIEGGSHHHLPGGVGMRFGLGAQQVPIIEDASGAGRANREPKYSVAVLEVQFAALQQRDIVDSPALEEREQRKLEGPAAPESEAA